MAPCNYSKLQLSILRLQLLQILEIQMKESSALRPWRSAMTKSYTHFMPNASAVVWGYNTMIMGFKKSMTHRDCDYAWLQWYRTIPTTCWSSHQQKKAPARLGRRVNRYTNLYYEQKTLSTLSWKQCKWCKSWATPIHVIWQKISPHKAQRLHKTFSLVK